ncbi:sugar ABC transporter substrate-binding protein [Ancylobacter sp. MQZ15Z-1]|uniref:Sugar ABC transporter substrate-binding protein n=1 Tax=Ancylobacter mangrovi TaxID=2972472 RepID=A0A9X2P9P6_9HYPH|nr:sugar ABC transporter substrate-binding protein [Ancylobacter mangrovi]MCS0494639.1 sugar ABC transporter substrate-binding protein [Ancylobacter mangrovi]
MAQQQVVRFLHNETDPPSIEFYNKAIAEFEKENPGIEIQMEAVGTDARLQKVMATISAKTMPEVFKILPEEVPEFAKRGYIMKLDDFVDQIGRDDFVAGSIATVDGAAYSVPYTMGNFSVLFYRKDLLDAKGIAVPKNWDELKAAAKALTGNGVYGFVFPAGKNRMTSIFFSSLMWSAGGTYFDKDLNVTFNNPGTIKALQFMKDMKAYAPPGIASYSYNDMINSYMTGTVALDIYASRLPANAAANTPDLFAKTEAAPMPIGPAGLAVHYVSPDSFALTTPAAGSKSPEAAQKFLKFIITGERLKDFSMTAFPHLIPPLKSVQAELIKDGSVQLDNRTEFAEQAFNTTNALDFDIEAGATFKDGKVTLSGVRNPYIGPIIARDIPAVVVQRVVLQGEDPAAAAAWGAKQMQQIVDDLKSN